MTLTHPVVTPSFLSGRRGEEERTVATESDANVREIQSSSDRACCRGEITCESLLQLLVRVRSKYLPEERLETSLCYRFRRQVNLSPRRFRHRRSRLHCTNQQDPTKLIKIAQS